MNFTWSEHLSWADEAELVAMMRQRESTGRPLGDKSFVKMIGDLLSRDLLPKKPGRKPGRKNTKNIKIGKT